MPESTSNPSNGANKTAKRNLPSWISARENAGQSQVKKAVDAGTNEASDDIHKQAKGSSKGRVGETPSKENENGGRSSAFSKLLEGVVFALSGFVNPGRGLLRSQALEMGAEYKPDWNSDCTLLVCAFPNTPKFRQVEAECGTIVSKDWIAECYKQKKLVDIESYLMHVGKPWRRQTVACEADDGQQPLSSKNFQRQSEKVAASKPSTSASSKSGASNPPKDFFPPERVKKWALDDLEKTITWLERQEEKPESSEIKIVAAEGILTCLQDTIDSIKQEQGTKQITEQWSFIPRAVEELAKIEHPNSGLSLSMEDLLRHAMSCKQIYEAELNLEITNSTARRKKPKNSLSEKDHSRRKVHSSGSAAYEYDSDETIEMTEDEIDQAYDAIASKLRTAQ